MPDRPAHLTRENAARFQDQSVAEAYPLRLPYPPAIFDKLDELVTDTPRMVLDAGTGTGEIARPLATRVERVDALGPSAAMLVKGKTLPGGDRPNLRWIQGRAEEAPLQPPYALITAGDSLHWMDWEVVLPRFHDLLTPHGLLAIVHRAEVPPPWHECLGELVETHSTMKNFLKNFDLIHELESRNLFEQQGTYETPPVAHRQAIDDYLMSFRSFSYLSTEKMPSDRVRAFEEELRRLTAPFSEDGYVTRQTHGSIVWGRPHTG